MLPELDDVEQRVVGSLLEKERTVPASYPMTLNALRTACNQSSSRDPVVDYDDATVVAAVDRLKARGLARMVYASHGSRVVKYRQVLDERLDLADADRALLTVLLLRGPQAAGELKTRTERLHPFADRGEVEACLGALAGADAPLVREQDRQPGQQDTRWVHLLGPVALAGPGGSAGTASAAGGGLPPGQATEAVLADGPVARDDRVRSTYDTVAAAYAERYADHLDAAPLDRWLLERLPFLAAGGPMADAGCGPGHATFHLAAAGADVTGFDLSPAMVAEARHRYPELRFEVADLTALPAPATAAKWRSSGSQDDHQLRHLAGSGGDGSREGNGWAAIAAWYSLVHLAASELRPAIGLLAAALAPGGWLGVAVHLGDDARTVEEVAGEPVDGGVTFTLHHHDRVLDAVAAAGLVDVEWYHRGPYPAIEADTDRLYVLARRPL